MLDEKTVKTRIDLINNRMKSLSATRDPAVNYVLKQAGMNGGKRLRGLIVLLTAAACGCKNRQKAIDLACAIELTHHATLIHDDIVDNSAKRRGDLTLNRKIGGAFSVLTGDYLFSRSMDIILRDDDYELFRSFASAIRDVCEGEITETYNKYDAGLGRKTCLEIVRKKTGALIRASTEAGALCAGVTPERMRRISAFGENMGIAFQIKDDLLDILGKFCKIGKSTFNDIREGKATLPLVLALENAPPAKGRAIKKLFGKKINGANVSKIVAFIKQYNGIELAEKTAALYVQNAKSELKKAGLKDGPELELLNRLADYAVNREY